MRDLQRVEDGEILAMPHDILKGPRDRLVITFDVRQSRDQGLLQPWDVRLAPVQFLGQGERRRPIAFLKECVE
jgi:hypothetical protein